METESEGKDLIVRQDMEPALEPAQVVDFGKKAAEVLKDVVTQAKLTKMISGNEYIMFEGWQTVAKFYKHTVGIEWTKAIYLEENDRNPANLVGFEARAYVKDEKGIVISTAESYCGKDEDHWKDRPIFAIRSMAQTRASAKALRQVFAWVVVLAGYKATPCEEMDGIQIKKNYTSAKLGNAGNELVCKECGHQLSEKVYNFSMSKFQTPLCFQHQKELEKKLTEQNTESAEINGK